MERASRLLGGSRLKSVERAGVRVYHLAPGAWAAAVGRPIARHTRPSWLENGKLTVEVEDAVWQAQLSSLRGQILSRLATLFGPGLIEQIEFRVVPPKKGQQRATQESPQDASEHIEDPVMRRLYLAAKRKATA